MVKNKVESSTRLNFYMKNTFVEAVDEFADSLGVSRPAALNFIVAQWMESRKTMDAFNSIGKFANRSNSDSISDSANSAD